LPLAKGNINLRLDLIDNVLRPWHSVNIGPFEGGSPRGGSLFVWFEGIIKCEVRDQILVMRHMPRIPSDRPLHLKSSLSPSPLIHGRKLWRVRRLLIAKENLNHDHCIH
jgi:hypothetical protein